MVSLNSFTEEKDKGNNNDNDNDNDNNNNNINIPDILSDIEEDLTFSQIINKYNDDSMFNSSMFGDNTNPDTHSLKSASEDDTGFTHTTPDNNISVTTNNTDPKNTQNLRCYLE